MLTNACYHAYDIQSRNAFTDVRILPGKLHISEARVNRLQQSLLPHDAVPARCMLWLSVHRSLHIYMSVTSWHSVNG